MVSGAARSPLPITGIARAHTRPKLNFSSGFVRCAPVYLCIARNRISPRWRAIPAACNLPLARPPRAPAPTISFLQIHHLLHSLDNNQAFNICCTHVFWFLNIYNQLQCDRDQFDSRPSGVFYGHKLVSLWDWSTLDLTFWDGRSFNSVICPRRDCWRSVIMKHSFGIPDN